MHQCDVARLDNLLDVEVKDSLAGREISQLLSQFFLTLLYFARLIQKDRFRVVDASTESISPSAMYCWKRRQISSGLFAGILYLLCYLEIKSSTETQSGLSRLEINY